MCRENPPSHLKWRPGLEASPCGFRGSRSPVNGIAGKHPRRSGLGSCAAGPASKCPWRGSGAQSCGQGNIQAAGRWFSANASRGAGLEGAWGQGDGSGGLGLVFHPVGEGGSLGLEEEGPMAALTLLIPASSQAALTSSGDRTDP